MGKRFGFKLTNSVCLRLKQTLKKNLFLFLEEVRVEFIRTHKLKIGVS